jgi:hypothetical protein
MRARDPADLCPVERDGHAEAGGDAKELVDMYVVGDDLAKEQEDREGGEEEACGALARR